MKMDVNEDSCDSFPYIDDVPTSDESPPQQYNLKISENYQNKNRDIEITNRSPNDVPECFGPERSEPNDFREAETRRQMRTFAPSGMKLVIKGCSSSISIQGLDNKSSITFKRRCEKVQKKEAGVEERTAKANAEESKPKRRRWKMLTKSLMLARSARFERRGVDERYPKYVLLKNEDDDATKVKENYPKMFVFNERKQKGNSGLKPDFNLKKSFKNKTEPIVPLEEILTKTEKRQSRKSSEVIKPKQKQPLTDRCRSENRNPLTENRNMVERRNSLKLNERRGSMGCPLPQGFVCGEIQGIFEDTLKLLPQSLEVQQSDGTRQPQNALPPQFLHFPCRDQYCCLEAPDQVLQYIPAHCPPKYVCKNSHTQTCQHTAERNEGEGDEDLDNLPFGFLSSFFPRVVIMNTIQSEDVRGEVGREGAISNSDYDSSKPEVKDSESQDEGNVKAPGGSQILRDPMPESRATQQPIMAAPEDSFLSDVSVKESSDEELKTKTQESESTTEYLHYKEITDPTENEAADRQNGSTPPPRYESKGSALSPLEKYKVQHGEENFENLSLTKIGYKMYDNLTKLSLNREKDAMKKPEGRGCGCNGNETKKSPCNITFESSSSLVKVTVPENELNFQIVNSLGADIQIGVRSGGRGIGKEEEEEGKKTFRREEDEGKEIFQKEEKEKEKKVVRREELWHSGGGGRTVVLQNEGISEADGAGTAFQKVKVSLADNKAVVLSIEMTEGDKKEDNAREKRTKEMKVGTDDFNLAGGDFDCSSGGSHKNLSPRIGRLLKHLHDKLESDQRERKFLDEKINQKLLRQGNALPGVFLVKHISPRNEVGGKAAGVAAFEKAKKLTDKEERSGQPREYYCEECLATLRIFEDENPSVKSMVDKFETIIQLESC